MSTYTRGGPLCTYETTTVPTVSHTYTRVPLAYTPLQDYFRFHIGTRGPRWIHFIYESIRDAIQ